MPAFGSLARAAIAAGMCISALAAADCKGAVSDAACPGQARALAVQGSTLCVAVDDPAQGIRPELLQTWVDRSARIAAQYYGHFPARLVTLHIRTSPGGGVHGGRTVNEPELAIEVTVGREITAGELAADWVLVHEMVHLALPEIGRRHDWLAEGLATYVEGIARAQLGNRDIADVWAEYRHSMPLGLPRAGEGGMDETAAWGRIYWGGALFCLQADVGIRERTGNRAGLQTALRAILDGTGGYGAERGIGEVLRIGDEATGTRVMQDLYQSVKSAPVAPDLELLWKRLGVPEDPKSQPFDDHAPLAAIRIAITRKP